MGRGLAASHCRWGGGGGGWTEDRTAEVFFFGVCVGELCDLWLVFLWFPVVFWFWKYVGGGVGSGNLSSYS